VLAIASKVCVEGGDLLKYRVPFLCSRWGRGAFVLPLPCPLLLLLLLTCPFPVPVPIVLPTIYIPVSRKHQRSEGNTEVKAFKRRRQQDRDWERKGHMSGGKSRNGSGSTNAHCPSKD
jgi:hypothetical protein